MMGENSKIEWTDHSWNPWIGCTKISPACDNCYAEAMIDGWLKKGRWGAHADRARTSAANWKKPLAWNRKSEVTGTRQRVFCASLADVFDNHKSIEDECRTDLWALIRATPWLDWQLLTKRPQNIKKYLPADWGDGYPNVWLGTTAENPEELERRADKLCDIPAVIHFLSCEPLLGPLDVLRFLKRGDHELRQTDPLAASMLGTAVASGHAWVSPRKIDWIIAGGESGPSARPMHPDWIRSLRDQCASANVPFFFKQWGQWFPFYDRDIDDPDWRNVPRETPNVTRINLAGGSGFHGDRVVYFRKMSKTTAGRLLDGVEHNAFPTASACGRLPIVYGKFPTPKANR